MPYGKIAEEIKRKIENGEINPKNGEINPKEAGAFDVMLDEYGLCIPKKVGKIKGSLRTRKFKVIER